MQRPPRSDNKNAVSSPQPAYRLRAGGMVWRDVDDEVLVLDSLGSVYLSINRTGAVMWRRLVEGATHDELVEALLATFEVDASLAAKDANAFIATALAMKLLAELP